MATLAQGGLNRELFYTFGSSCCQDLLAQIAGPKSREGVKVMVAVSICLAPRGNSEDSTAMVVYIDGRKVGHLPPRHNQELRALFARTGVTEAMCNASIEGGWSNERSEGDCCVCLDMDWPPRLEGEHLYPTAGLN